MMEFKEFVDLMDSMSTDERQELFDLLQRYAELKEIRIQLRLAGLDKDAVYTWGPEFMGKPKLLQALIRMFAFFGRDGMDQMIHELVYGL